MISLMSETYLTPCDEAIGASSSRLSRAIRKSAVLSWSQAILPSVAGTNREKCGVTRMTPGVLSVAYVPV